MSNRDEATSNYRRELLKLILGSPLLYLSGSWRLASAEGLSPTHCPHASHRGKGSQLASQLITSPEDALNIFDFESVAAHRLPPAHFGFIKTGVANDSTVRENRQALQRLKLKLRRLVNVNRVDTQCSIFGENWPSPIALAPVGSHRALHAQGEIATARAAQAAGSRVLVLTVDVVARGPGIWSNASKKPQR